jgi:WGR domain
MKKYINEKAGKEWTIEITEDNVVKTAIGKIGEKGVVGTRGLTSRELAEKKAEQLTAEKLKQGYVLAADEPVETAEEKPQ